MDELIIKIEDTVSALLQYDMSAYASLAQELVNLLLASIPSVIDCYNNPNMADVREDAAYWPGQLQRIIASLGNGGLF